MAGKPSSAHPTKRGYELNLATNHAPPENAIKAALNYQASDNNEQIQHPTPSCRSALELTWQGTSMNLDLSVSSAQKGCQDNQGRDR